MSETWVRVAIVLLKPFEALHSWRVRRAIRTGKYRR